MTRQQMCSSSRQQRPRQANKRGCAGAALESTAVSQLFEGQISYKSVCMHCDQQTCSTQTSTVLSLPIPTEPRKCSIQTILTGGGEQLLCSVYELRRETTIFTSLDKPLEILTLHRKRFGRKEKNQVKFRTNVLFSTKLSLSPFLSSPEPNSSYSLYAVVNHTGNLNMGHYTALCHSPVTGTWHHFDGAAVREVQDESVHSSSAYMLLYSRKPMQKPNIHGPSL